MRQFLNGVGADTTTAVVAYLASQRQVALADLVLIGSPENPLATWLTNWNSPLTWSIWGTFQPATIKRDKIKSQIGLEVADLNFEWSPPLSAFGTSLSTANPYQKAQSGFYDNLTFRLWRCVMPTPGDANTYGACSYFGGRIAESKVTRGKITFVVNSFLDVVNQQVPPNVIELNNTLANFAGNTPVVADGETEIPQFVVTTPTAIPGRNPQVDILGRCTGPTANKIYGLNKFLNGFLVFNAGSTLAGYWSPIANSGNSGNIGLGATRYNHFLCLAAFPWPPSPGDTFYCATKPPINLQDAAAGFEYFGFPYVPQPESAA